MFEKLLTSTVHTKTTQTIHTFFFYFCYNFWPYILIIDRYKSTGTEGEVPQKRAPSVAVFHVMIINTYSKVIPILIRSDKMQQYAGIYLLQIYSTCFGCPSHPSSGLHKTVTASSGTGHSNNIATIFLQRGL